jgi:hypothetical protein
MHKKNIESNTIENKLKIYQIHSFCISLHKDSKLEKMKFLRNFLTDFFHFQKYKIYRQI